MNGTDILRKEHDAILKMLDFTDDSARQLEAGQRVRPQLLNDALAFFQVFVNRCHCGKEEELLFPLLERRSLPHVPDTIGAMWSEHTNARRQLREMVDAAVAYAYGVPNAGPQWAAAARTYSETLRAHIDIENRLLSLADRRLSYEDQEALATAFEELESEKVGTLMRKRLQAQVDALLIQAAVAA